MKTSQAFDRRSSDHAGSPAPSRPLGKPNLSDCIRQSLLRAVFQPIGSLRNGGLLGHEALIRGPAGSTIEAAGTLFEMAARENLVPELELFAARLALQTFASTGTPGKLFLNFSTVGIRQRVIEAARISAFLDELAFESSRVVIELTEHSDIGCVAALKADLAVLRGLGFEVALDDYGSGNATRGLWAALAPDYIKIDRSLVHGVSSSSF